MGKLEAEQAHHSLPPHFLVGGPMLLGGWGVWTTMWKLSAGTDAVGAGEGGTRLSHIYLRFMRLESLKSTGASLGELLCCATTYPHSHCRNGVAQGVRPAVEALA